MDDNSIFGFLKGLASIALLTVILASLSACSDSSATEDGTENNVPSSELVLDIIPDVLNYSELGEVINYNYVITNTGDVDLDGPVIIQNPWMDATCPELDTIGNKDSQLQPGETVTCTSFHTVTQDDLEADAIVNSAIAAAGKFLSSEVNVSIDNIAEKLFIFPFDSIDPAVVFRSELNSAEAIIQSGGTEEVGSQNHYDGVLGMKPEAALNGVPGCRFTSASIAGLATLPRGQLSIEVEREWLAITDPEVDSNGYDHTSIEYLLSYGPTSDVMSLGRLYMQPDESLLLRFVPAEGTKTAHFVNTGQSDRFARITLSWTPGEARLYVDGLFIGHVDRTDHSPHMLANLYLGTLGGLSSNAMNSDYYIRNLIVSSKPVTSTSLPLLSHVMQLGDSFAAGVPLANLPTKYDGTIANTVIGELFSAGISYEKYTVYSNGGGKIQDSSDDPLELDVTNGGGKTREEALLEDPTLILFITGGNDFSIFDSDVFANDLHDHIESYLWVNGYIPTNVE